MVLLLIWLLTIVSTYNCLGDQKKLLEWNDGKVQNISHSNERFSSNLFHLLRKKHQNLVFSPFSISTVMAMLSTGARGETLKQIEKVLFFPPSPNLQAEYKKIIPAIRSTKDFTIETANKVFANKDFPILREFQETMMNSFYSSIQDIDFGDPEAAANTINGWVKDMTRDKIKHLIQPFMINGYTLLVLGNAIYFKSNWVKGFDQTFPDDFRISPSSTIKVPMMSKEDTVFSAELGLLSSEMIELPYKGDRFVMQVLLPDIGIRLEDLEAKLKDVDINELFEKGKRKYPQIISLPKFKIESTIQLKEDLKKLGLKKIFSRGAEFSGITDYKGLRVSHMVQKAIIEVNEKGTEAAAATEADASGKSGSWFEANRPFIFYIRDKKTGMLLFQGRVINPLK